VTSARKKGRRKGGKILKINFENLYRARKVLSKVSRRKFESLGSMESKLRDGHFLTKKCHGIHLKGNEIQN